MILRKPYAFFAKHFKKIHLILAVLVAYLVYRTNLLFNFFNECVSIEQNVTGQDLTGPLFNIFMFIIPFLWILISIIILSLMVAKKKPFTFYVVNIAMAIGVLILYTYTNDLIGTMELRLVDIRTIRAIRDIVMFVFLAQSVVTCMVIVRATGFDIKKFNFGEDLAGINVEEEDREEFEVNLELDTDKTKRDLRRNLRYAKYIYVENKYLIHLVAIVAVVVISFITYMNLAVYHKTYQASNRFSIAGLNMQIQNVYTVTQDYKGNRITENGKSLIVLDLNVKKTGSTKRTIEKAAAVLMLGNHKFYHVETYRDKLIDLGKTYELEEISKDEQNYLLVYEVPTSYLNKNMKFEYYDKNTFGVGIDLQNVTVKLTAKNLETKASTIDVELEKEMELKDSILKDSKIIISKSEIKSVFTHAYRYCPRVNECYDSIEYVKPNIVNTYDKTLLKLTGSFVQGEKSHVLGIYDLYDFIQLFGHVEYVVDGKTRVQTVSFREVNPSHNRNKNEYYIEILKEVEQAEKVFLVLKIRNVNYQYRIK